MKRRTFVGVSALGAALPSLGTDEEAKWTTAAPLPRQVQELYPAVHQEKLYVAGGIAARLGVPYFTNKVSAYSAASDAWEDVPDLPEDLHHIALVSTGDKLFGLGGFNGGYTHLWRMRDAVYQLEEDGWTQIDTMPTRQAEGVVTHREGWVHVVTGQQPKGEANIERSDHTEGRLHWIWDGQHWDQLAPIPTARNSATGGWIGGLLVVTGGRTAEGNLSVTEIYDAKTDAWHTAAPLPLPQAGTASVVVDGALYVFGGEIFQPEAGVFPNVWRYDLAGDRWDPLPDMLTPRHGIGAGMLGGRAYVVGGATAPGGSGTSNVNEVMTLP